MDNVMDMFVVVKSAMKSLGRMNAHYLRTHVAILAQLSIPNYHSMTERSISSTCIILNLGEKNCLQSNLSSYKNAIQNLPI
jgi:hypothetical protein